MLITIRQFSKPLLIAVTSLLAVLSTSVALAADAPPPSPIKADKVTTLSLGASADFMGTIHSKMHLSITAGVSGRVEWIAEPGTFIKAGESIVKMDMLPLKLKHAEQKSSVKRAHIHAKYLKNELTRWQTLEKTEAVSQFQIDQTTSEYELALVDIEIAELKLQQIDDEITRATVKAPYDGVVTQRTVLAGTEVNRSDELSKFIDTEHLEARVYVPIKHLINVRLGNQLTLMTDEQEINAKITAIIPSADPRSQTFEVRIEIPTHLNSQWSAGQLVKVTVPIQSAKSTLTVHRDALILRKDGTYVVKISDDNTIKRLKVEVGKGSVDRVSILGDLIDGDRVATRGAERLKDGQSVVIQ